MMTIPQAFAIAVQHYQAGNLHQAEQLCAQVLQEDPRHVGGLFLLGLIDRLVGRYDLAVEKLTQAVHLKPDFTEAHNSLGNALRAQGRLEEAVASYQLALHLNPHLAEAHNNLGVALMERGKLQEAVASLQQALALKPNYAEAHNNLGVTLKKQGRFAEAAASLEQALRLKPDYVEAHNNLGAALAQQGKREAAAARYRQALALKADYVEAHYNLGNVLREQGNLQEAVPSLRQALRLKPNYVDAHNSLGIALYEQGKLEESVAHYREALLLQPDYAEVHSNLANALKGQGKLVEAADSYQQALRLKPDYADGHRNLAMAWLLMGNFEQGWLEYEWRWKCEEFKNAAFCEPPWDGSDLRGKTIFLVAEQGLGDTLQFIRYARVVKQQGATVFFACPKPLAQLLATCAGIDHLAASSAELPPFNVQAPLLSLPRILQTTLATVPAEVPYLFADAKRLDHWHRELSPVQAFKIGIAWSGSPKHREDRQRSMPLAQFAPLARLEGVRLFSLQKGPGSEQLEQLANRFPVTDLGSMLDENTAPFMDTAAVMKNVDLVITCDTAIAHLAGALGVPVWVALPFAPDWRWLLNREDSPWYPTMRLFRQSERGAWDEVFQRVKTALQQLLNS